MARRSRFIIDSTTRLRLLYGNGSSDNYTFVVRRSNRNCESKYGSSTASLESPRKKNRREPWLQARSGLLKDDVDCHVLFRLCLLRMLPHVWVKIIPSSLSDDENFAFSIGQKWDVLQPLMLELNFLYKYKDTVRLRLDKIKDLEKQCVDGLDIHIGSSHPKGEKLTYYICRDTPIFKCPLLQIKNKFEFADLQFKNSSDTQLQESINNYFVNKKEVEQSIPIIHRERVITSVKSPSINESTEIVTPPPAPPPNYIQQQINAALSLDLHLFVDSVVVNIRHIL